MEVRTCMSTTITLDSIREAAEAKYGSTDIQIGDEVVRLLNPLRLTKEKRQRLVETQKQLDTDPATAAEVDQEALLSESIRIVAAGPQQAQLLLDAVGGDLAVLAEIFAAYSKGAQVGEASASRD
jgi:hypothetical protein